MARRLWPLWLLAALCVLVSRRLPVHLPPVFGAVLGAGDRPRPRLPSVLVIGAGPAGLALLQQLKTDAGDGVRFVCWDQQPLPGGQWTGLKPFSATYNGMWINTDKAHTEFARYPFRAHYGAELRSYFPRALVVDYVAGYVARFGLREHVVPGVRVTGLRWDRDRGQFAVASLRVAEVGVGNTSETVVRGPARPVEFFDYVVVATGKFQVPRHVHTPGFTGEQVHAMRWPGPARYAGRAVLVVGYSYSAMDIATLLIKYGARRVALSVRRWEERGLADALLQEDACVAQDWVNRSTGRRTARCWSFAGVAHRGAVVRAAGRTVHFARGGPLEFDSIVYATGYDSGASVAFVEAPLRLAIAGAPAGHYDALHLNVVWHANPRLLYLAFPAMVYNFPEFEAQAAYAARLITGRIPQPAATDRNASADRATYLADWAARVGAQACGPDPWFTSHAPLGGEQLWRIQRLERAAGGEAPAGPPRSALLEDHFWRGHRDRVDAARQLGHLRCPCASSWLEVQGRTKDVQTRSVDSPAKPLPPTENQLYMKVLDNTADCYFDASKCRGPRF